MAFTIRTRIEGLKPLLSRLDGLKRATQKSVVRKAVDAASKVVLDAIKPLVPRDTGLLAKSMGRKVVVGRHSGVALAIVGPRTGFKIVRQETRTAGAVTGFRKNRKTGKVSKIILRRGSRKGPVGQNPTQYAHLVEGGRKAVAVKTGRVLSAGVGMTYGTHAAAVAPVRFMERGLAAARPRIVAAMASVIQAALAKANRGQAA